MKRRVQLADFEGPWRIEREIEDSLGGKPGRFSGTAVFSADGALLRYRETGLLTYGDASPLHATREYIWSADGAGIVVTHGDGQPFHRFDTADLTPEADHHCAPDLYHVRYDFTRWPDWRAEWAVSGPRKDYRMVSRYQRV
ncbi:DUF6314 family protein [Frigidibacter sp. RF13]|uniref:DUF6314 family protein n=1 Tax=Frigidibacter sp. RF13 TaxID=2997340 RepID=UPI0022704195|nr:DUF6314 family protein [Frigidibacter sp. RF13]MCY1125446.1 DUF6314 family protein [Frigidibacter sp. RF13]